MTTTISFNPDGTAHRLWTEAVPLHTLGRLEVRRASTIEFESANQVWEVRDLNRIVRFSTRSRAVCLEWEQQNLQPDYNCNCFISLEGPSVQMH